MIVRARWVLPIERPPIEDGWVSVEDGVIRAIGDGRPPFGAIKDLGDAAILPGLINAHTHLELSFLRGRIAPAPTMAQWIRGLMGARRAAPHEDEQREAAAVALAEARTSGTIAVGDISNSLITGPVLAASRTPSVLFHELLGFVPRDVDARVSQAADAVTRGVSPPVSPGLAPHAPFSTAPELIAALTRESRARRLPMSIHLGESQEEVELLRTGKGAFRDLLVELGAWHDDWTVPGADPVAYLDSLGAISPGMLAVHATQLDAAALAVLAARGAVIVSCPRSNEWVGAGDPPLDDFYASGAVVALGTDSLASVGSLDMFDEIAAARRVSTVSDATLLESATRGGAVALGLDGSYGRIAPGLRGPLLAVAVPPDVADVQEYLVSGEHQERQWVG